MSSIYSVLQHVTPASIRRDPFVHVVIDNCLPQDLYAALARTYPTDKIILRMAGAPIPWLLRENERHDASALAVLDSASDISPEWREFVRYHSSAAFFRELVALLGPDIRATHPNLETRLGHPLEECATAIRYSGGEATSQIALECQIGINTPLAHASSVRRLHTDDTRSLYAILFYCRQEGDTAVGGDLELFSWKKNIRRLFVGQAVEQDDAELVDVVSYKANTLVILVNSESAVHAVTARAPSNLSRRLVNIVGRLDRSVPEGLYVKHQKPGVMRLIGVTWSRAHTRLLLEAHRIFARAGFGA